MDTWDRLVLNSSLPTSGYDAYNHLNSQVGGDASVVGMGEYTVSYVSDEKKIIHMPDTASIKLVFNNLNRLTIKYSEAKPMVIKYVEPLETEVIL